jgi:hypothetical protein
MARVERHEQAVAPPIIDGVGHQPAVVEQESTFV